MSVRRVMPSPEPIVARTTTDVAMMPTSSSSTIASSMVQHLVDCSVACVRMVFVAGDLGSKPLSQPWLAWVFWLVAELRVRAAEPEDCGSRTAGEGPSGAGSGATARGLGGMASDSEDSPRH